MNFLANNTFLLFVLARFNSCKCKMKLLQAQGFVLASARFAVKYIIITQNSKSDQYVVT